MNPAYPLLWILLFVPVILAAASIAMDLRAIREFIEGGMWSIEMERNEDGD